MHKLERSALAGLRAVRGVTWRWRASAPRSARRTQPVGVVAQDVERVFPELVTRGRRGHKAVHYTGLIGPLIEAVKELDGRLTEVERRLGEPEAQTTASDETASADQVVDPRDRFRRAPYVSDELVGSEGLLYDERHGRVHVLNQTATWVWDHCTEELDVGQLTARFAESCDTDPPQVAGDVARLLDDLLAKGLIERASAPR